MPKRAAVNEWLRRYDNPMKPVVLAIRDVILGTDARVDECIKWQAPTFTYSGNIASFYPKSKQHASLMFHQGAKIPGKFPLLTGTGNTSRVLKLASLDEVEAAQDQIEAIIRSWITWKEGDDAATSTRRARKATPRAKSGAGTRTSTKESPASPKRQRAPIRKK